MRNGAIHSSARTYSVKELLSRSIPGLTRVTDQAARADFWNGWLCRQLPTDLAGHVSGIVARDGTLVIFAPSAEWSARLRYAMHELAPKIRAADETITAVVVRVRPPE